MINSALYQLASIPAHDVLIVAFMACLYLVFALVVTAINRGEKRK